MLMRSELQGPRRLRRPEPPNRRTVRAIAPHGQAAGSTYWPEETCMDLSAYLRRIRYEGEASPDRATLDAVQRAHLLAIPYENLDVQLGRRRTTDPQQAFDKLVTQGRGGWCYEMNG